MGLFVCSLEPDLDYNNELQGDIFFLPSELTFKDMFVNLESNLFSFTIVERSLLDPVGDWFGGGVSLPFGIAVQEHIYSFFKLISPNIMLFYIM